MSKMPDFKINKPLIPLKMAVFFWFGANATLSPFIGIYLKQLGLSLLGYAMIYTVFPLFMLMGSVSSGVIADKIGRPKVVLLWNVVLVAVTANFLLLIPQLKGNSCPKISDATRSSGITCYNSVNVSCDIMDGEVAVINCNFHCSDDLELFNHTCFENYISVCELWKQHDIHYNFTIADEDWQAAMTSSPCIKEDETTNDIMDTETFCHKHSVRNCTAFCEEHISNNRNKKVKCESQEGKVLLFTIVFIAQTFYSIFYSNIYRALDFTAMSMVKTHNSYYGRQRLWSIFGIMIFAPLCGLLISLVSPEYGEKRYDVIFYLFDGLILLVFLSSWKLDVDTQPPSKNMIKTALVYFKNPDVSVFFVMVLVCGTAFGFDWLFLNLFLQDIGASPFLMGLNAGLLSLLGLPFLFISHRFVKKIGCDKYLVLTLLVYSIVFTGYSYLTNPWWSLAFQPLGVITYHINWVAVITHCHNTSPYGLALTSISLAGGIHYGIGKGTASLIGGFVMNKYGGRTAFRVMAAISAVIALWYALFLYARRNVKYQKQLPQFSAEKNEKADILLQNEKEDILLKNEKEDILLKNEKEHILLKNEKEDILLKNEKEDILLKDEIR